MRRVREAYANASTGGHRIQTVEEMNHASQMPAGEYTAMLI